MVSGSSVPNGIDTSRPSVARMYDYYLGGKDHFAVDRAAAEQAIASFPEVPVLARTNRAFLGRVVRYLARDCGIRQFIDLGTGIPTAGNVHEVAQRADPGARVVYVDNDPIVLAHGRALLEDAGQGDSVRVIDADMRDPSSVLSNADVDALIDWSQPLGVLFISVLHFVTADPGKITAAYRDAVAPGSYLALSHLSYGTAGESEVDEAADRVYGSTASGLVSRTADEIEGLFAGFDLVEPGLVPVAEWRPDPDERPEHTQLQILGAVGRKAGEEASA